MILEKYISNLIYRNDCIIVPGFGAFIGQKMQSSFDSKSGNFLPPHKRLSFNPALTQSDGLLIQEVARAEGWNFDKARQEVEARIQFWKNHLNVNSNLILSDLGQFTKDENNLLQFEAQHPNYLPEAFGLDSVKMPYILRESNETTSSSTIWWKAAALIPILVGGFLYFGKPQPFSNYVNEQWAGFVSPVMNPEVKAVKVVESPIKAMEIQAETVKNEIKEAEKIHRHQVIAGAFRLESEVAPFVEELKARGHENARFTQKKGNYYYVAYDTFDDLEEAHNCRREKEADYASVWILSLEE